MNQVNKIIAFLFFLNFLLGCLIWFLLQPAYPPQIFLQVPYQPAKIVVNANLSLGEVKPFWRGLAQGGEETGGMLTDTVEKIKPLRPAYIRLDHIFDDDYYGVAKSGLTNLDWSRLDREVEAILAAGAKPFFSLSYMPSVLADSKIGAPRNWNDWQNLVKATVEHYSGKGGKNISGVYYEVWNEPDLELFGGWQRSGQKNYLTLYEYAVRGAMAAQNVNHFLIGGPATTGLYYGWLTDLYNFCAQKKLRLDFFSWHRYSHNPYQYAADVMSLYNELGGRPLPKLVISEWGPTPEKSNLYNSAYAAVHSLAVARQLIEQVDLSLVFEIKDGPGQEDSGWGLLTHQSAGLQPKPRYQAFLWLNQMVGERLSLSGEGSHVKAWASKKDGKISMLLTNFGSDATLEGVLVEVNQLEPGSWRLTREVMFGRKDTQEVILSEGVLRTTLELKPNQAGRIILERK